MGKAFADHPSAVQIDDARTVPHLPASASESSSPRRVLIVSHHPEAAGTLALMCNILGWRAITAISMEEACLLAENHSFDLVITDHYLPPNNGLLLIQQLRRLGLTMPAVITTNEPTIAEFSHPPFLNIRHVLVEPLAMRKLKAVLDETIQP